MNFELRIMNFELSGGDDFYEVGMDGGHGNGDDSLYLDDDTTVAGALHFQEDAFLAGEVTAGDTYTGSFRQIQLFGTEVKQVVVVGAGHGDETLHLDVGDDYLLTAAGIGDVLQVGDLRLDTLQFRRAGMDKDQVADDGNQGTDFLAPADAYLVLHGDKTAQALLLQQADGVGFPAVGGTHGVPYFGFFFRVHGMCRFRKGCSPGALDSLH